MSGAVRKRKKPSDPNPGGAALSGAAHEKLANLSRSDLVDILSAQANANPDLAQALLQYECRAAPNDGT